MKPTDLAEGNGWIACVREISLKSAAFLIAQFIFWNVLFPPPPTGYHCLSKSEIARHRLCPLRLELP
jgi:hypothetical protein